MNENHGASPFQVLEQGLEPIVAQVDAVCVRKQNHAIQIQDIIGVGQLGERADLEQATGHHHVLDEMEYLVWIGEVGMDEHRRSPRKTTQGHQRLGAPDSRQS
jgi:hypothetical protein